MTDSAYPSPTWRYWWGTLDLVVAGYGVDPERFCSELKRLVATTGTPTKPPWQQQGNWSFAACKTYNPDHIPVIDTRLMGLAGFYLRIKLKSSLGWTLAAFADAKELLTYHHDFSLLHPRQLDRSYIATLTKAYEGQLDAYLEDYELNLPPDLQEQWRSLTFIESHLQCMDWYQQTCADAADHLWDLFQQYGVACDRQELADILTGKRCIPEELEWYVGNLPQFLTAIGLSEVFWDWQTELKAMHEVEADH